MIKQLLEQIADYFLKDVERLPDSEISKARVFISSCLFSSFLISVAAINRLFITDSIPILGLSLGFVLMSFPFLVKKTKSYQGLAILFPLLTLIATPLFTYLRGGIASGHSTLFILVPILSYYFVGSKKGTILSTIGLLFLLLFLFLDLRGFKYPYSLGLAKEQVSQIGIALISIYILISYIIWHYERLNTETQERNRENKVKAEKANKTKDIFWANISHEIRTPLNGILGMTNLVLDSRINKEQKELLEIIKDSAENLNIILSDVIDYSKIENKELEIVKRPFELAHCLEEVIQLFQHMANEKNIKLHYMIDSDVPKAVLTDQNRLKQVLINLVANAIKFTDHGSVKIIVEKSAKKDTLNFIIEDTGIGIAEKKMERLFKPFTQIDDGRTRKYGGTGLGLIICKKILELLDGTISVESKVGSGSVFTFTIKALQVQLSPHRGSSFSDKKNHLTKSLQLEVLIAEDNAVNRKLLISLLNKNHIYPDVAQNGLEAYEMSKEKNYDLIFMDVQMPVMDGITASKKIITHYKTQENIEKARPTIIAVTANVLQEDRDKCFEAGMDDFMAKPINNNILVSVIERYSQQVVSKSPYSNRVIDIDFHEEGFDSSQIIQAKRNNSSYKTKKYKYFDAKKLLQHFADDYFIIENMFEQFLNKYSEDISVLQDALDTKDYKLLALRAHSLKGTFTTLFCSQGHELSIKLEAYGKKGEQSGEVLDGAQELLDSLRDLSEELIKEYQEFLKHKKVS